MIYFLITLIITLAIVIAVVVTSKIEENKLKERERCDREKLIFHDEKMRQKRVKEESQKKEYLDKMFKDNPDANVWDIVVFSSGESKEGRVFDRIGLDINGNYTFGDGSMVFSTFDVALERLTKGYRDPQCMIFNAGFKIVPKKMMWYGWHSK